MGEDGRAARERKAGEGGGGGALEHASKASNDMSATMDELQSGFHERGEKLSKLSDKTAELADASAEFEAMCRKLNQQQQRKAWW